jgi:hypothetical protein
MGDLKTNWSNPGTPIPDLSGDLATSRGTDPNIDTGGSSGLTASPFDKPIDPSLDGAESPNSVSGLPPQPNRFQPTEQPPEPPSLQDRNPGTIDKR